jgi:hypothetical protein
MVMFGSLIGGRIECPVIYTTGSRSHTTSLHLDNLGLQLGSLRFVSVSSLSYHPLMDIVIRESDAALELQETLRSQLQVILEEPEAFDTLLAG